MGQRQNGTQIAYSSRRGSAGHMVGVNEQKDYAATKQKIIDTTKSMSFVSLEDFHKRVLHPGESLY